MYTIVLMLSMIGLSHIDFVKELDASYEVVDNKAEVTLQWELSLPITDPKCQIIVFRGKKPVAMLSGTDTEWSTEETGYGKYQYTVAWIWNRNIYDYKTGILNVGRLAFEKPDIGNPAPGEVGYYVYVLDSEILPQIPPDPALDTAEIDPENPHEVTTISLSTLYDKGVITVDQPVFISIATWFVEAIIDEEEYRIVSNMTDVLMFVYTIETWDIPELSTIPKQPVLQW